jgi:CRISPR-associated protein Cas1
MDRLFLTTPGSKLGVLDRQFFVRTPGQETVAQHSPARLVAIEIHAPISITSDAVLLALDYQIDVVFLQGGGEPLGRLWNSKFGSISSLRLAQLAFSGSEAATSWVAQQLTARLRGQIDLLHSYLRDRPAKAPGLQAAILTLGQQAQVFAQWPSEPIGDAAPKMRGHEGGASAAYFQAVSDLLPKAYRFDKRSRKPALDPFNALLNYALGMLYAQVEAACIRAGLDPHIGIYHADGYNRPVLVFDLIEPYRVWAEAVCLQLFISRADMADCFAPAPAGKGIWLSKKGKALLIPALNAYLSEVVQAGGKRRQRRNHIFEDCVALANVIRNFSNQ